MTENRSAISRRRTWQYSYNTDQFHDWFLYKALYGIFFLKTKLLDTTYDHVRIEWPSNAKLKYFKKLTQNRQRATYDAKRSLNSMYFDWNYD